MPMKTLVTGGAGFIGSHIVDYLMTNNHEVVVYDNFSTGKLEFLNHHLNSKKFKLINADLKDTNQLDKAMKSVNFVFHLAAHADVRSGYTDHTIDHEQNLEMTRNVLESMVKNKVKKIMFASTSSVYGDAQIHPTPETCPFEPTSLYGSSKAACESYLSAYSAYYDIQTFIFRFVSFVGERYTHGIVHDVLKKLSINKESLDLFSDGTPKKSSLYVGDGVEAIFKVIHESDKRFNVYNIGNNEVNSVNQIVSWILDEAKSNKTKRNWLGKTSNWKGDNEYVHLDTTKLKAMGWTSKTSMEEGVRKTVRYLSSYLNLSIE